MPPSYSGNGPVCKARSRAPRGPSHSCPSRLGRDDLQVAQVLDLAGGDDHVAEYITAVHEPLDGARPVLEAGDQALDAEPAVAADPDAGLELLFGRMPWSAGGSG